MKEEGRRAREGQSAIGVSQIQREQSWGVVPFAINYECSTSGAIRFKDSGRLLKFTYTDTYPRVTLKCDRTGKSTGYGVHRVVATTFIPNPDMCRCVNHRDGDKSNPHVSNLEWCTYSENMQHAYDTGLKKPTRGNPIHTPLGVFSHEREAARANGLSHVSLRWRINSTNYPAWYKL